MRKTLLSVSIGLFTAFGAFAGDFLDTLASDTRKVASSPYATGGDHILKISDCEYVHVFCTPGAAAAFVPSQTLYAQVLLVGGGGGGGSYNAGGGGGGGGYVEQDMQFASGETYAVTVGAGGAAGVQGTYDGANGGNTQLGEVIAYGGGGGGGNNHPGLNGASSGGGGAESNGGQNPGALSVEGQGNLGAKGVSNRVGGGGGGAGAPALVGDATTPSNGGDGKVSYILGYQQYFAGGGGGGMRYRPGYDDGYNGIPTQGGLGGGASGGFGFIPEPAEDGLGGGGGGGDKGSKNFGSRGGSGIVIIRYFVRPESGAAAIYTGGAVLGGVCVRVVNAPGQGITLECKYGYAPNDLTAGTLTADTVRSDHTFSVVPPSGCPLYCEVTSPQFPGVRLTYSIPAARILGNGTLRVAGAGSAFKYDVLAAPPSAPAKHIFQLYMGTSADEMTLRKEWTGADPGTQIVSGGGKPEEIGEFIYWYIKSVVTVGGYEFVEVTATAMTMLIDDVSYSWNPEVTSGSWTDPASWIPSPGAVGQVPTSGSSASFDECLPETPYEIILDEDVTVSSVYSRTAKQQLKFKSTVGAKLTTDIDLIQANSTNTFDGIVLDASPTPKRGNGFDVDGYVIILTNGTSATFTEFYSRKSGVLYVGKDCTAVINNVGQEGGAKTFIVDDGILNHRGFVGQNNGSATIDYVVKGKKGQVVFRLGELYLNNAWKRVRFSFEIPDGGYDQVPVVFDKTGNDDVFLKSGSDGKNGNDIKGSNFCKGEDDTGLIFEVLPTSPILFSGADKAGSHDLFVWSKKGFAYDDTNANPSKWYDMHDYTTLVVPKQRADGQDVKSFSMSIRGVDEVSYADAKSLRATGTIAYAVSYEAARAPGFNVFIR